MSKNIIKGDELQIWVGYNNTWLNPKFATSHTLSLTGSTIDTNTKDHGYWSASSVGKLSWEITAECLYTDGDFDTLFDYMIQKKQLDVIFAEVRNYSTNGLIAVGGDVTKWEPAAKQRRGKCVITSINANANTGEFASFSLTFTGSGVLRSVDYSETNQWLDVTYSLAELAAKNYKIYNTRNGNDYVMSIVASGVNHSSDTFALDHTGYIQKDVVDHFNDLGELRINVRYYLSDNVIPAHMFQSNKSIEAFNGHFTRDVTVGEYAFAYSVVRDSKITNSYGIYYGNNCFEGCSGLEALNYAQGTPSKSDLYACQVGDNAFNGSSLEQVDLSSQTQEDIIIGYQAFANMERLVEVSFDSRTYEIKQNAFANADNVITYEFAQEYAPIVDDYTFGEQDYCVFNLRYVSSVSAFLAGGDGKMGQYYPESICEYNLLS